MNEACTELVYIRDPINTRYARPLQSSRHFTYVTTHSPTLPSLYIRHSSFSNLPLLYLRHSSFSNPSLASPTSQALHLIHLASRPWKEPLWRASIPGIYRIPRGEENDLYFYNSLLRRKIPSIPNSAELRS